MDSPMSCYKFLVEKIHQKQKMAACQIELKNYNAKKNLNILYNNACATTYNGTYLLSPNNFFLNTLLHFLG